MPDSTSLSSAREMLETHGLFPKKRLGQNFLVDKNIVTKIVDSCGLNQEEYVVEIGPGLGAMTRELASRSKGVLAIDIDTGLEPVLKGLTDEYKNIAILFKDILEIDLEAELKRAFHLEENVSYRVCANIPYNITSPIIFKLMEECPHLISTTLMMQKEVAKRLLATPNNKDYGRLTITTRYHARVEPVMNVSRNCFYPRPEVDSAVVRMTPQKEEKVYLHNEKMFNDLLRAAFQKRRKTMLNICTDFFSMEKAQMATNLEQLGIPSQHRPENLSIEDFAALVNRFSS